MRSLKLEVVRAETWTHAPNLYFLVEDSIIHAVCDLLQMIDRGPFRTLESRLRGFACSTFHQHVLQLRLFKVLYDRTPWLNERLRRNNLGHEFFLAARKASNPLTCSSGC